jgi:ssDNA-binding replication factor A large subunit
MRKISVNAKVIDVYPIRTFKREGNDNKVATLLIADDTSSVRTVLWDTNHIKLIETNEIKEGSVVEIKDASVRAGELHLGSLSSIKLLNEDIGNIVVKQNLEEKSIANIKQNDSCVLRAVMVQMFEPRFFAVCSECSGKVQPEGDKFTCSAHGIVIPQYRAIVSLVIDDGTENIRAVCFDESAKQLFGLQDTSELKDASLFLRKKEELLGRELYFSGRARQNKVFGNIEFVISEANEIKLQELIQKLSK